MSLANMLKRRVHCKPISKVSHKHSNSFVSQSTGHVYDSPDPSLSCKHRNTSFSKSVAPVVVPELMNNLSNKSLKTYAGCKVSY